MDQPKEPVPTSTPKRRDWMEFRSGMPKELKSECLLFSDLRGRSL